jgi:hypothetical protein
VSQNLIHRTAILNAHICRLKALDHAPLKAEELLNGTGG